MAQTPEEKKAYMAKWRAENKQRIYLKKHAKTHEEYLACLS
jgi:hypothetical protein